MTRRLIPMLALLLLVDVAWTWAQTDTVALTLPECIRLAQANGPLGIIARSSFDSRVSTYRSFAATLYPQLSLEGNVPGYFRSINTIVQPDGSTVFTPQSQASASLSLGLTQKIPLTGGELSLSSGMNRIDLLESKTQYYRSTPLSLTLSQPLFQINTISWDREAQNISYQMAPRELAEAMEDRHGDPLDGRPISAHAAKGRIALRWPSAERDGLDRSDDPLLRVDGERAPQD